jgi:hypothetical protein
LNGCCRKTCNFDSTYFQKLPINSNRITAFQRRLITQAETKKIVKHAFKVSALWVLRILNLLDRGIILQGGKSDSNGEAAEEQKWGFGELNRRLCTDGNVGHHGRYTPDRSIENMWQLIQINRA